MHNVVWVPVQHLNVCLSLGQLVKTTVALNKNASQCRWHLPFIGFMRYKTCHFSLEGWILMATYTNTDTVLQVLSTKLDLQLLAQRCICDELLIGYFNSLYVSFICSNTSVLAITTVSKQSIHRLKKMFLYSTCSLVFAHQTGIFANVHSRTNKRPVKR